MPRGRVQQIGWTEDGECWVWDGPTSPDGYVHCSRKHDGVKHNMAHRWAYHRFREPIPDGMEIDHLCRRRNCVNPEHLEVVTHAENIRRAARFRPKKKLGTHCGNGHEYTEHTTYIDPRGYRQCRTCRTAAVRRVYAKRRAHQDTQT